MRNRNVNTFTALLLTVLFLGYWCSTTLFLHTHWVDGTRVVHSHPYTGMPSTHSHSGSQLQTIDLLSLTAALVPSLAAMLAPLYGRGIGHVRRNRSHIARIATSAALLRAPPVCYTFA